jgi:hypothetical protein
VRSKDNPDGHSPNLATAVTLLKTPTAQLAVNGGSQHPDKRKAGGHGPTLADQVEHLLPTPTARMQDRTEEEATRRHQPGRQMGRGGGASPDLASVAALLPTPNATDGKGSNASIGRTRKDGRRRLAGDADLPEVVALLPTPRATYGGEDPENFRRRFATPRQDGTPSYSGMPLNVAVEMLPTPTAGDSAHGGPRQYYSRGGTGLTAASLALTTGDADPPALLPTPTAQAAKHAEIAPSENRVEDDSNLWVVATRIGERTAPRLHAGSRSSDGQLPGQLSLDELASGFPPLSSSS